jgi:hypothetical protein
MLWFGVAHKAHFLVAVVILFILVGFSGVLRLNMSIVWV